MDGWLFLLAVVNGLVGCGVGYLWGWHAAARLHRELFHEYTAHLQDMLREQLEEWAK